MSAPRTYRDLVAEAKRTIREIAPADVMALRRQDHAHKLIDIREDHEVNLGIIPGALHASRGNLEKLIEGLATRDEQVVLYCATGNRSALAALTLERMGYSNVASMAGGIVAWAGEDGEIE
jgi:rhodanese-related sulfurtransferase